MRDYDPTTGRYMQPDPLGLIDGASVYGYARANPGRYVDVRGLASCTYSISTKTLSCTSESGISMTLDPGIVHSGMGECRDNPDCSEIPNTGPIPPNTYDMIRTEKFGGSYWLDEGRIDRFFSDRSGFFLHEGTRSLGCITVESGDPAWDKLISLLDGDTNSTMTVTE